MFELAPCPLCHSEQVQLCRDFNNQAKDFCRCRHCKCTGPYSLWQQQQRAPYAFDVPVRGTTRHDLIRAEWFNRQGIVPPSGSIPLFRHYAEGAQASRVS